MFSWIIWRETIPQLKPYFYGTVACDRLPKTPDKKTPRGYIVNTDPYDQPGQHWLALWTIRTCVK